jgi:hypothetical protein
MLSQAIFALVVFAITAATIAEANRAKAAVASLNNGNGDITGVLSAFNLKCFGSSNIHSYGHFACAYQHKVARCWPLALTDHDPT